MKKYLLDTNICIYHIKGLFDIDKKQFSIPTLAIFLSMSKNPDL